MSFLRSARRFGVALVVVGCAVVAAAPAQATFPGQNGKIVFSKDGDLWTIDPDGTNLSPLTTGDRVDWRPRWAPDGSMIAFNGDECTSCTYWSPGYDGFGVYVWRPDGSVTRFGASRVDYTDAAWSPQSKLVFATEKNGVFDDPPGQFSNLMVANVDGTDQRLIAGILPSSEPDWSPLGDRIAFLQHYDGSVIGLMSPDGTSLPGGPNVASPGDIPQDVSPSWSPDGARIAFAGGNGAISPGCSGQCVFTGNPDGSDIQRLTSDSGSWETGTAWSPDGSEIAFAHRDSSSAASEIWIMNVDGSDPHFLTEGNDPDWQPLIAPRHLDPPRVVGSPREGRATAAARGLWLGTPTLDYTYQWALCDGGGQNCADIPGATDRLYTPTHDDVLHRLRVTVTATNDYGDGTGTSEVSAVVGESLAGTPDSESLLGTAGSDLVFGRAGGDTIMLDAANDVGRGGYGNDWIAGGAGNDFLTGGPSHDRLRGGSGRDRIYARDRYRDWISCGPGRDVVRADFRDRVATNCEIVWYG